MTEFSKIELPSNKKFGYFFTFIFAVLATYFTWVDSVLLAKSLAVLSASFLLITLISPQILLPLNKLWMRFGLLIGMIISPIVLALIFYGIFTPYALVMRLFGRDELDLRLKKAETSWKIRSQEMPQTNFKQQF